MGWKVDLEFYFTVCSWRMEFVAGGRNSSSMYRIGCPWIMAWRKQLQQWGSSSLVVQGDFIKEFAYRDRRRDVEEVKFAILCIETFRTGINSGIADEFLRAMEAFRCGI